MKPAEVFAPIATGAPRDIYSGRVIKATSGYDIDASKARGYTREVRGTGFRPGAMTPKTTRTFVDHSAPRTVGRNPTTGNLARMRAQWDAKGPSGSRVDWHSANPKHSGPDPRARMRMSDTPAMGVVKSAVAATGGGMRLGSYVLNTDPSVSPYYLPEPPTGRSRGVSPVPCLPGSGSCVSADPGVRPAWGKVQNQGQARVTAYTPLNSPLPTYGDHPLSVPSHEPKMMLPLDAPGQRHVVAADGSESYVSEPGYPSYQTPFGYTGGHRTNESAPAPGGKTVSKKPAPKRAMIIAAAVAAGALVLLRRKGR